MDSEGNTPQSSSPQKNGGNICAAEVKEKCESTLPEDDTSQILFDKTSKPLLTDETALTDTSNPNDESQIIFAGENTQMITENERAKEIMEGNIENVHADLEDLGSSSVKEVAKEVGISENEIKGSKHHGNILDVREKNSEKMHSSVKLDETLVIESDEDGREEEKFNKKSTGDEVEEIQSGETNFGDFSEATTVDIADLGDKAPRSPEDLFASQSLGDVAKQNTENSLIEYEDFIPSSLPSQSEKCVTEDVEVADNTNISTPLKRKMEECDTVYNEAKVPRLLISTEADAVDETNNDSEQIKKEEVIKRVSEEAKSTEQSTSLEQNTAPLVGLCDQLNDCEETKKDTEGNKLENSKELKESENLLELSKTSDISKNPRKSVEIVFSSFEKSSSQNLSNQVTQDLTRSLATVPEENGEEYDDNWHLRMSLSQDSQSFAQIDISQTEDEVKSIATKRNSNEDVTSSCNFSNSHHGSKSDSTVNSHSSNETQKVISDTVTVHDNSDVEITSPEAKVLTSNEVEVLKTVENGSFVKQNTDSDVTVILDKNEENGNLYLGHLKHRDMNGTLLKRKHPEIEDVEKLDVVETDRTCAEADLRKRSRLMNQTSEGRSTPDLPHLPNKGTFQSTPIDNSGVPSMNASVSTVGPSSLSAGKCNHQDSLPLRDVECTIVMKCYMRFQVNEDLRQIHSAEFLQCQDAEDFRFMGTANPRESSGGSAADESKNSSPSSVMSVGPFPLKQQSWRYSSSSTSTTSSGHSILGVKSKSADGNFTAPLKLPPIRSSRTRNLHFSSEFSSDLFDILEKRTYIDETEPRVLLSSSNTAPAISCALSMPETEDVIEDIPQNKPETQAHVLETPKSTKKLTRSARSTRSTGRNLASKVMKEIKEEESSLRRTPDKEMQACGDSSGSQKKSRKTPFRSSKRNTSITSSTPEETKVSTSTPATTATGTPSGRSRRNRNEQTQNEKVESSSHESSHITDWDPEGCFTKLVLEAPVFARWTDKKYYPGKIKEKIKDGRWVIEFDDKTVRALKEEFIIPINILTKGQIVFAYEGEDYEQGIIVEFKLKEGEVQYGVDLDSGRKLFVPRSRLFMSEDQARLLQENMDPKSPTTSSPALTTVSCDNIVHHKRPRATRVLFGNGSPSVSGVTKSAKRPSHDTSCSSSVSDSNDKGSTLVLDEVGGVDPEVPSSFPEALHTPSGRGKGPGRIKSKTRTPRRNASANHSVTDMQECNTLHEVLGPIPAKGSKMFSGKCFLLTNSGGRPVDHCKTTMSSKSSKKSDHTSGSEYDDASTDDGIISKIPFVKEHLRRQLEAGGGTVFENFEDVPEDQYQNCFLIANRPSLTAKYILCLASSIKILNHLWVIEGAKGSSHSWDSARLQIGWDLESQRFVPPEISVRTRKQKPLSKKEVGIVNESQTFIKFWERILELLGANVRHISPGSPEQDRQFSGVDVIVADSTCPPEVQDRAREWSIPLVSTVWITQSLISGRIRPFTGHPHYRYDFCTSE